MPSLGVDPTQSVFTGSGLVVGQTYWLLETRSPEGFALLAAPVPFTVTATGIQLVDPAADGDLVTVTGTNGLGLTVVNAPAADLPKAGGPGFLLNLLLGLALVGLGGLALHRTSGHRAPS